jgi:hypothetical protein
MAEHGHIEGFAIGREANVVRIAGQIVRKHFDLSLFWPIKIVAIFGGNYSLNFKW